MTSTGPALSSLRLKLAVTILLTVLLSLSALSLLLLSTIRRETLGRLLGQAAVLSRSVERVLNLDRARPGRPAEAPPPYQDTLLAFSDEENLLGLVLVEASGREAARQGVSFPVTAGRWEVGAEGMEYRFLAGSSPLLLVRASLGRSRPPLSLVMAFSLEQFHRTIALFQLKAILQGSVSALLIFAFLVLLLSAMVVRPIGTINRAIERIASGNLDVRVDLPVRDELGYLARSLNTMAATLRQNRETIQTQMEALRKAHRETLDAQTRLIAAEKLASLGTLAAGVAHEVGNPLGAVIGFINLLAQGAIPKEEQADILRRSLEELNRIHRIMLELLNYARPSPEPSSPLDLNEIIVSLVESLRGDGALKHLDVTLELAESLPRPLGFPHKMEQVFINLIRNAVWATSPRGRLVIRTASDRGDGAAAGGQPGVVITFADDGRGIPEEDRERIFDPFYTTRLGQGGTGLGLSISRRIVEEMGGHIGVDSREGEKTSFLIRLPV